MWAALAAVALLWPGAISGPLDGIPLDAVADAVLIGVLFPALCCLDLSFLRSRLPRVLIVSLLAWKAFTSAALVHDGWCVSVIPSRPYVKDQTGLPHNWDLRADWGSPNPSCSAIMTRSYRQADELPVWFFNLPAADGLMPSGEDIPPGATTRMTVDGTLTTARPGVLQLDTARSVTATMAVDGLRPRSDGAIDVPAGSHHVSIDATLVKVQWRLMVLWNGDDAFGHVTTTRSTMSTIDHVVRPWGRWISPLLAGSLLLLWTVTSIRRVLRGWPLVWVLVASLVMGLTAVVVPVNRWQWAVLALMLAAVLPLRGRARSLRGAFLLVGVPWLVFVVVATKYDIGRMTFYGAGNDYWQFQRFAYRIFMQGYWLEGGERTFWFQPLYRWLAGALHLVFGDSSVGEEYFNGACLTAMALFSFAVTRAFAGARWALAAAAFTLALFMAGPGVVFIQNGLSEIASAGFIYLGALFAMASRRGSYVMAIAAGLCAVLGFYTRLNNFPFAAAILLFALPPAMPASTLFRPSAWLPRVSVRTIATVCAVVATGLVFFAWRTYHYTGIFSVTRGTALDPERGGDARMLWAHATSMREWLASVYDSVMMVLTAADPPRIHNGSIPLLAAAVLAVAAIVRIPPLGALPLPAVLFMLASLAGAVIARGAAYPGRFSIHVVGAAATLCVCASAEIVRRMRPQQITKSPDEPIS